jgi:hypothetical protein
MSPEFRNNLISLTVGWALGIITQQIGRLISSRQQKRKVFTRLHRILEEIFIEIEVQRVSKDAGVLQTFEGLFDVDESWTHKLPPKPPRLPDDFKGVLEQFSDWEAQRGKYEVTKKLYGLESLIRQSAAIYAGLTALAKLPEENIPERPLSIHSTNVEEIKELTSDLLRETWPIRLNLYRRTLRRIRRYRRKRKAQQKPLNGDHLAQT